MNCTNIAGFKAPSISVLRRRSRSSFEFVEQGARNERSGSVFSTHREQFQCMCICQSIWQGTECKIGYSGGYSTWLSPKHSTTNTSSYLMWAGCHPRFKIIPNSSHSSKDVWALSTAHILRHSSQVKMLLTTRIKREAFLKMFLQHAPLI